MMGTGRAIVGGLILTLAAAPSRGQEAAESGFTMTRAVVVSRVDGFDDYVVLPDAILTSEDKLKVYFRPLNFKIEPVKDPKPTRRFRARFTEDGRIRRKGEKTPLFKEDKLLEYDADLDSADRQVFLVNNIGLKDLKPGEYEFDITLHDALSGGDAIARQTVAFTVKPVADARPAEPTPAEPKPAKKATAKKRPARPVAPG